MYFNSRSRRPPASAPAAFVVPASPVSVRTAPALARKSTAWRNLSSLPLDTNHYGDPNQFACPGHSVAASVLFRHSGSIVPQRLGTGESAAVQLQCCGTFDSMQATDRCLGRGGGGSSNQLNRAVMSNQGMASLVKALG